METFHQYLESIAEIKERNAVNVSKIAIQDVQPEDFDEIIDLRPSEDFEEDNIPTSRNIPVLTRSECRDVVERRQNESFIISLVWSLIETFYRLALQSFDAQLASTAECFYLK